MDRPSSPGTLPSAHGLEQLRLCPGQRQHRQGSTSYLHCSEGTHLGMFLLHIPPGLTLAVKTAKGSKLVSSGMGFPPTQRDHELPAVAKLSQNTHSYFKTAYFSHFYQLIYIPDLPECFYRSIRIPQVNAVQLVQNQQGLKPKRVSLKDRT